MAVLSKLRVEAGLLLSALLRGCGQVAFCDSLRASGLIVAGVALASPFAALGMLYGALVGTISGRWMPGYGRDGWTWGLAGFNPAIVGLVGGGFLASGEIHPAVLVPMFLLSMVLDLGFQRMLHPGKLPALSAGAVTTVYAVSLAMAPPGGWFWTQAPGGSFPYSEWLGGACIVAALLQNSPFAAMWALLLSAIALLASYLAVGDARALSGLWGVTVPLACYGVHAVFMRGSLAGCVAGTIAAGLSAALWVAWSVSALADSLPPLLVPFIVGVWLAIAAMRKADKLAIAHPEFWRLVRLLVRARSSHRDVLALVSDLRPAGSTSTFLNGAWLDPQMRLAFERERLRQSAPCRQALWKAADRLRREASDITGHGKLGKQLAGLATHRWVDAIVLQDVHLPTRMSGSGRLVPLHGDIQRTQCLECGARGAWPPAAVWRHCDLRCSACEGAIIPGITLFGSDVDPGISKPLRDIVEHCAIVLVVGREAPEPATLALLDAARRAGAVIVFMSQEAGGYPRRANDRTVQGSAERCLAWLRPVLALWGTLAIARIPRPDRTSAVAVTRSARQEVVE